MNHLPPLSGAILISNPRKTTMANARLNSVHKRINRLTRVAMRSVAQANPRSPSRFRSKHLNEADRQQLKGLAASTISRWDQVKNQGVGLRSEAGFGRGDANEWYAHVTSGEARTPTAKDKATRSFLKQEFARLLGVKQKRLGGKADMYRVHGKYETYEWSPSSAAQAKYFKAGKRRKRKVPSSGTFGNRPTKAEYAAQYAATQFSGYNAKREAFRGTQAGWHTQAPWGPDPAPGVSTWKGTGPYKASGHVLAEMRGGGAYVAKPRKGRKGRKGGKRAPTAYNLHYGAARKAGASHQEAVASWHASKGRSNPFVGDLALTNQGFGGVTQYLSGYAAPVLVAGAAAGGLTAWASTQGWTETLAEGVGNIPVVGEFVEDNLPYTLQGLLVGTGLAMLAPMVGGMPGKYLALTGGAALVFGGGIDAFNYILGGDEGEEDYDEDYEEDYDEDYEEEILDEEIDISGLAFGDLALENISALGDLALENVSALGDLALEGGPGGLNNPFQGASLTQGSDYGQASWADAYYSGADFSGEEGQALLNGRQRYRRRFGSPSHRMAGRTAGGPSHHAGKAGHRWGWLIRTVGWQKAQQICALPPKSRIRVIHKLRKAAIATYQQLINESQVIQAETHSADPEFEFVTPAAGTGASGANGATNYLGDPALFMGA